MLLAYAGRDCSGMQAVYGNTVRLKPLSQRAGEEHIGQLRSAVDVKHLEFVLRLQVVKLHAFHKFMGTGSHVHNASTGSG